MEMLSFKLDKTARGQGCCFGLRLKKQSHAKSTIFNEISLSPAYSDAVNKGMVPSQKEFYTFNSEAYGLHILEFEYPHKVCPLRCGREVGG